MSRHSSGSGDEDPLLNDSEIENCKSFRDKAIYSQIANDWSSLVSSDKGDVPGQRYYEILVLRFIISFPTYLPVERVVLVNERVLCS